MRLVVTYLSKQSSGDAARDSRARRRHQHRPTPPLSAFLRPPSALDRDEISVLGFMPIISALSSCTMAWQAKVPQPEAAQLPINPDRSH